MLTEIFAVSVGLDTRETDVRVPNESFRFDTVVVLGVGPLGMCFLVKRRVLGAEHLSRWISQSTV